uniref:Secreted protein n=1 Tax=Plectus sambesii TaxID=2011161 RepID=A0A914X169_9BILA
MGHLAVIVLAGWSSLERESTASRGIYPARMSHGQTDAKTIATRPRSSTAQTKTQTEFTNSGRRHKRTKSNTHRRRPHGCLLGNRASHLGQRRRTKALIPPENNCARVAGLWGYDANAAVGRREVFRDVLSSRKKRAKRTAFGSSILCRAHMSVLRFSGKTSARESVKCCCGPTKRVDGRQQQTATQPKYNRADGAYQATGGGDDSERRRTLGSGVRSAASNVLTRCVARS